MFFKLECVFLSVAVFGIFQTCSTAQKTPAGNSSSQINQQINNKNMPANTDKNSVSSDVDALRQKVELPFAPLEAVWLEEKLGNPDNSVPGPTDYRLTAVLKFSNSDAEQLMKKIGAEKLPGGTIQIEEWFPSELKNKAAGGELGGTKYDAGEFSRSPYTSGTISRVENSDYFVLKLLSF